MKKLLVVLTKLKTPHNGLWEVAYQFGNHLIDLIDFDKWEVTFLVPRNYPFKSPKIIYKKALFIHRFTAYFWKYDVVHVIEQNNPYLRYKNNFSKYITTIHDLNHLFTKSYLKQQKYNFLYQKNILGNHRIVCISEYTKNNLTTYLNTYDIPLSVIYNGVFLKSNVDILRPQKLPNRTFIFFIGTFMRKKNIHTLVQMMEFLPEYDLVIAGQIIQKKYFQEVENLIHQKKLTSQIHCLGALTENEKHYCYQHCEAFVFPSIAEGFGIPPIEAMLHGKTVFSSTSTSLPEICGNMAWYWENFEPKYMAEVVHKKLELQNVPQNNPTQLMEYAKKYDWKKCVDQYITLYNQVTL